MGRFEVRIFIESTWKGLSKQDGVAVWMIECLKNDRTYTRQGFIHLENGTEAEGCLMALINAFHTLKKPCSATVHVRNQHILNTVQGHWHIQWQKNGWKNAKGSPVKHPKLWELLIDKTREHIYTVVKEPHEYVDVMGFELEREFARWKDAKP